MNYASGSEKTVSGSQIFLIWSCAPLFKLFIDSGKVTRGHIFLPTVPHSYLVTIHYNFSAVIIIGAQCLRDISFNSSAKFCVKTHDPTESLFPPTQQLQKVFKCPEQHVIYD